MNYAYDPQSWQNFYVMTGGSAAALTGLLFVAMSLHARTITSHPVYFNRAVGTLMSLTTQLLIAGAVLVPGQSLTALGVEVEAAALFFLVTTIRAILLFNRHRAKLRYRQVRSVIELIGGSIWLVLFVTSGLSLITRAGGGFYVLAVVMAFMFGWNIYIAWTLITEISE